MLASRWPWKEKNNSRRRRRRWWWWWWSGDSSLLIQTSIASDEALFCREEKPWERERERERERGISNLLNMYVLRILRYYVFGSIDVFLHNSYMYIYIHTYMIHIYTYTFICTYIYIYSIYVYIHICIYVCVCIGMYVCNGCIGFPNDSLSFSVIHDLWWNPLH